MANSQSKDITRPDGATVETGFSLNYLNSFTFEDQALPWFNIGGVFYVPTWIVGRALGVAKDGRSLVDSFTTDWADEVEDVADHLMLTGQNLADFKAVCEAAGLSTKIVESRAPSLHLISKAGVDLACMKTNKPVGKRMRKWLRREAFPAIRETGAYRDPAAISAPDSAAVADPRLAKEMRALESLRVRAEREKRLAAVEDRKQREMRARGYTMQYEAVATVNPPSPATAAAFKRFIGAVLAGGDLAEAAGQRALPVPEGAPMDLTITASAHYMSVTDGAAEIGTNKNVYGRIVKRLCQIEKVDYLAGVEGFTRAKVGMTKTTEAGFQMAVAQYDVTPAMNEKVAAVLAEDRGHKAAERAEIERRKADRADAAAAKRAEADRIRAQRAATRRQSSAPVLPFSAPKKGEGECA